MTKLEKLEKMSKQLNAARAKVQALEEKLEAEKSALRSMVTVTKNKETFTLTIGARRLTVKPNSRGRLCVKESGRMIDGDAMYGMNDLRIALALGTI